MSRQLPCLLTKEMHLQKQIVIENGPDIPAFDFLSDNLNNYVSEIFDSSVTVENSAKCGFHRAAVDNDAPF